MPRFRSLSEAVRHHVESVVHVANIPQALPLSVNTGRGRGMDELAGGSEEISLRWGDSIWGIHPVTGYLFPGQLATPTDPGEPIQ